MEIYKELLKSTCYCCDGKKIVNNQPCSTCNGTGIWIEEIYYYINNKKKIAIDGDTLK